MTHLKSDKRDENANDAAAAAAAAKTKMLTQQQQVPPEGGYGWFIVLAYAIANVSRQTTTHSACIEHVLQIEEKTSYIFFKMRRKMKMFFSALQFFKKVIN